MAQAVAPDEAEARAAAQTYARKKKIGAFGEGEPDRATKQKQLAAMIRAGHGYDVARRVVEAKDATNALGARVPLYSELA